MAATALGKRVIMTEPTGWVGGQFTSQAVPADEHPWIERFGCTRRYRSFRNGVRQYYREHYPLKYESRLDSELNPGLGFVGSLCHEPRVSHAVMEQMLAYARACGLLDIRLFHRPISANVDGDRIHAVTFENVLNEQDVHIAADYVLDATELGDLLPLAGVEYVTGRESQKDTQEPHALSGPAEPDNIQAFTWCFALAYDPERGADHTIEKPSQYERWRDYEPDLNPPWSGRLLSFTQYNPHLKKAWDVTLFPPVAGVSEHALHPRWLYRRLLARDHFEPRHAPHEISLINWHQNDYFPGSIIDQPSEVVQARLEESRQLSLSLCYWLQTEAPRPEGGYGYPGLYLRPDVTGTEDGLAMAPYIRESRRIVPVFRVTENHVGTEARDEPHAERFSDSVGVGAYRMDRHATTGGENCLNLSALPFQIPLGALLPVRMKNLLAAGKNLGVTHLTNSCFRLHPVEWNVGESAGLLAAWCLENKTAPHAVRESPHQLSDFQSLLNRQGVEIEMDWAAIRPL